MTGTLGVGTINGSSGLVLENSSTGIAITLSSLIQTSGGTVLDNGSGTMTVGGNFTVNGTGTSSIAGNLSVAGGTFTLGNPGGTVSLNGSFSISGGLTCNSYSSSGSMTINPSSGSFIVEVGGTQYFQVSYNAANAQSCASFAHTIAIGLPTPPASAGGALYIGNTTGYTNCIVTLSSSIRFKEQVKTLDDCSWLYDLRPVSYHPKGECDPTRQIGLIAEEVAELCPQLTWKSDGLVSGVHYEWLGVPIIAEMKKLKKQMDELAEENVKLRTQLEQLTKENA